MKNNNLITRPDVLMIYEDKGNVELAVKQIIDLSLSFKSFKLAQQSISEINKFEPKVLLISSNDVKRSIQFYIEYLESSEQDITPHSAVLLINNRETLCAYLACENNLFDDYVIINPLNEPYRLKLVLIHQLKIMDDLKSNGLEELTSKGDEQLASCIEHGVALKRTFQSEVDGCKDNILEKIATSLNESETKAVLEKIISISLDELNSNLSSNFDDVIDRLLQFKEDNKAIHQDISELNAPKKKTADGVNTESLLASTEDTNKNVLRYKLLIAEPSELFSQVIHEIFSDTAFKFIIVNDGAVALEKIKELKPDVVLLAYDLPSFTGLDITRVIRKEGNSVPIIAYTHQRDLGVIKRWITLGLSGYLIKPSKRSLLLKSVNQAIKMPIDLIQYDNSSGKDKIIWVPKYSVNHQGLDDQHKALFEMINTFFLQEDELLAISILSDLSDYMELHFETEENLLKQINYPKYAEHIKQHDALRKKFQLLLTQLDNYDAEKHHKIASFLYKWLASHILKDDMDYKDYALSIDEPSFQ